MGQGAARGQHQAVVTIGKPPIPYVRYANPDGDIQRLHQVPAVLFSAGIELS
jgi:hypothetical protein